MTTPQPELLARWLQHQLDRGDVGTPPPAGLDPDVVEAVDALRPDLAPVPELDLDELLAGVTQGPFAVPAGESEHLAASELARRLDGGPLTPEQAADLDEGAFAAMAAIRPDRLPVPTFGVDDLWGDTDVPADTADAPTQILATPVLPPSAVPDAPLAAPANRRRWAVPLVAVLAMAATVLLVIGPQSDSLMSQPSPFDQAPMSAERPEILIAEVEEETQSPSNPTANHSAGAARATRANDSAAAAPDHGRMPRSSPATRGGLDNTNGAGGGRSGGLLGDGTTGGASRVGPAPRKKDSRRKTKKKAAKPQRPSGGAPGFARPPADPAPTTGSTTTLAAATDTEMTPAEAPRALRDDIGEKSSDRVDVPRTSNAPAPEADPEPTPAPAFRYEIAEIAEVAAPSPAMPEHMGADDDLDEFAPASGRGTSARRERNESRESPNQIDQRPKAMPSADSASQQPPVPAGGQRATASAVPAEASSDDVAAPRSMAELRAAAWGMRLPLRPKGPNDLIEALLVADQAAERAGATDSRIRILGKLMLSNGGADVIQDSAFRLARLQAGGGRTDLALATIAQGLQQPGGTGQRRAALYAQQGEILELRGDISGAADSYRRAVSTR